jgi:hypothetical protein
MKQISMFFTVVSILAALYFGLKSDPEEPVSPYGGGDDFKPSYRVGEMTDDGRIVVFALGDQFCTLESEAALVFRNGGTLEEPKVVFDLTTGNFGHQVYSSVEDLKIGLERMPEPRVVDFYQCCGAPPWYGIPQSKIDQFFRTMELSGVELRDQNPSGLLNFICTCPDPE